MNLYAVTSMFIITGIYMLIVISPAKTLDFKSELPTSEISDFQFTDEAQTLIDVLKEKSADEIKDLMSLSDKLAQLNKDRYEDWQLPFDSDSSRSSMFAFKGDVYQGLSAYDFNDEDIKFAQSHLRILSGLYGLLKPLDQIMPYRLEMGTKLEVGSAKNLYAFWEGKITKLLQQQMPEGEGQFLVNLASNEYFKSIKVKELGFDVITPQFLDEKNGKFKIISFYAKKARGLMSSWLIRNKITDKERLREFDSSGYRFDQERSSANEPVFIRNEAK